MARVELPLNVNSVSRISDGASFEGTVHTSGDLRIDGAFRGTIISKGRVIIGETATVNGKVACETVDLNGKMEGDLYVKETLTLKNGCEMKGGINIKKLVVELGAVFNGTCKMIPAEEFEASVKTLEEAGVQNGK